MLRVEKIKVYTLLLGGGLLCIQLLSRFFLPFQDHRLMVDLIFAFLILPFILREARWNSAVFPAVVLCAILIIQTTLSLVNGYGSPLTALHAIVVLVGLPLVLTTLLINRVPRAELGDYFSLWFVCPLLLINLLAAAVEFNIRDTGQFHSLQVSGRSYELIALSIGTLMMSDKITRQTKVPFYILFVVTLAISFSRGAMVIFALWCLYIIGGYLRSNFLLAISLGSSLILLISMSPLGSIVFEEIAFLRFWMLRLDIVAGTIPSLTLADLAGGRVDIYAACLKGINDVPLLGTGIGNTSSFFIAQNQGVAFSGCHNLPLSILLDHGVFAGLPVFFLISISVFVSFWQLLCRRSTAPLFFLFLLLLFGSTTGLKLFIVSDVARNGNVLLVLFIAIFSMTRSFPPEGGRK